MNSHQPSIFKPFQTKINAVITSRNGGFSQSPFATLNLAYHVGDNHQTVQQNHKHLSDHLSIEHKQIVYMKQVHGDNVQSIDKLPNITPSADALITNKKGIALMVMVADCNPILLYDAKNHAIAAIHAGRAGVFDQILVKTIKKMQYIYKTDPQHLYAYVGPSIRKCCYEVGEDVIAKAKELELENYIINNHLDLIAIIQKQFNSIGIPSKHIEIDNHCTACSTNNYYSYRKEGITGRFAGVIYLK